MTVTIKNLYKGPVLNTKLDAFAKRGVKLQEEAHKVACSVLAHVLEHKDVRMVHRLLLSMPDMVRTNGLRAWFEKYSPVRFVLDGAIENIILDKAHKKDGPGLGDAIENPFWKFKANEGVAYKPLDFDSFTRQQIKRIVADLENVPASDDNDPRKLLLDAIRSVRVSVHTPVVHPVPRPIDPLTIQ